MARIAVIGAAGPIGNSTVAALSAAGAETIAVGRRRDVLERALGGYPGVRCVQADATRTDELAAALSGAEAVVFAVGTPTYDRRFFAELPAVADSACRAARAAGVGRLLAVSNVYVYGPPLTPLVAESHPLKPNSVKGAHRLEMERVVLAHHGPEMRTVLVRPPDFLGLAAERSFADTIINAALDDKPANLLSPIDTPHEWIFTPDVGPMIAALLKAPDDAFGRAYNIAGPSHTTTRAFTEAIYAAVGARCRFRTVGLWGLYLLGMFDRMLYELQEMHYLQTTPVLLDDRDLAAVIGPLHKTPYTEAIPAAVAAVRAARAVRAAG